MKLARVGRPGQERPIVVVSETEGLDASGVVDDFTPAWLASGGLEELSRRVEEDELEPLSLDGVRLGPPLEGTRKIVCIGLNYADHAAEAEASVPSEPSIFFKAANTVIGPNDDVLIPVGSEKTDWEVELAIVIGNTCRYLPDIAAAAGAIAGYAISNDLSERHFQLEREGQWVKGKSCETFNPLGPWLVTPDEIPNPQDLALHLYVNGDERQSGHTSAMAFSAHHIVWYLSQFMVLDPGDVVNTGTPSGVGLRMKPPTFLQPGDVMELSIEGLGRQRQRCVQAERW
jgi:2-keto-4-pentenoate hydratase/2-oxohepta-3-ene-1,7-dioic acid hydratase in catechol pathway